MTDRSCADDHLVAEMLHQLDDDNLSDLADAYYFRVLNRQDADDLLNWGDHLIRLIKKKKPPTYWDALRALGILPVLFKHFSKSKALLCKTELSCLSKYQFAFRAHHQAEEVHFIKRQLIEKANEFNVPLFCLGGDFWKAYDTITHTRAVGALQRKNIPNPFIASWIRETRRARATPEVNGKRGRQIPRGRTVIQGDPAGPGIFNVVADEPVETFVLECQFAGWGYPITNYGPELLPLVIFADNFWLFATNPTSLSLMVERWRATTAEYGLTFDLADLEWCTTAPDSDNHVVQVDGYDIPRRSRSVGLTCLGSQITFDGRCSRDVDLRIRKAWGAFAVHRPQLTCPTAPLKDRHLLLETTVLQTLAWSSPTWRLTRKNRSKIRAVQQKMERAMIRTPKREGDTVAAYCIRAARARKNLASRFGWVDWDVKLTRRMLSFAGHVARYCREPEPRLALEVLHFRNREYLFDVMARNRGDQLHCRRLFVWRWEEQIFKVVGRRWEAAAMNADAWRVHLDEWAARLCV